MEAAGFGTQALALAPDDPQILRKQAATLANLGRDAEARELYQRYAALMGGRLVTVAQYRTFSIHLAARIFQAWLPSVKTCSPACARPACRRSEGGHSGLKTPRVFRFGNKGYLVLAIEWRVWRGLRSFMWRPLRSAIRPCTKPLAR